MGKDIHRKRIVSIDFVRGFIMILMALDHVRQFFHIDSFYYSPTDLSQADSATFWTRFITHFCAPLFIFLAGISARILGQKLLDYQLSKWLVIRGLWLIILEITIVKLVTLFNLNYDTIVLQVIWVIGVAMIFLAFFLHLPFKIGLTITIIGLIGHHFMEFINMDNSTLWVFLYQFKLIQLGSINVFVAYQVIPWVFVITLGYYIGEWYLAEYNLKERRNQLLYLGIAMIGLFFIGRLINSYGDPNQWELGSLIHTINSFFNVNKYPPSLFYLAITIGSGLVLLSLSESWKGSWVDKLVIIGRVPLFYYIVHFLLIHSLALIYALSSGYQFSDMIIDVWITTQTELRGFGTSLFGVYLIWIVVILIMYPLSNWFDKVKNSQYGKWWVSML